MNEKSMALCIAQARAALVVFNFGKYHNDPALRPHITWVAMAEAERLLRTSQKDVATGNNGCVINSFTRQFKHMKVVLDKWSSDWYHLYLFGDFGNLVDHKEFNVRGDALIGFIEMIDLAGKMDS